MCKPAQARFNPSNNNWRFFIHPADKVAVYNCRIIRPLPSNASWSIGILPPSLFGNSIVVHHRIHVACRYQKPQARPPKYLDAPFIFPIWLRNKANPITMRFQDPRNNRRPKRRMVYIRITIDLDKINLFPSSFFHVLLIDR